MHKDIRSYFQLKKPPKPKATAIEDDDDVIPESPDVQIRNKKKESRKKRVLSDSDEEIFAKKKKPSNEKPSRSNKTPEQPKLKEVQVQDMFGGPIKRTEPLVKKAPKVTETGIHSDEEFEKSLLEVDAEEIASNIKTDKPKTKNHETVKKQEVKEESSIKLNGDHKPKEEKDKHHKSELNSEEKDKHKHRDHKSSKHNHDEKHHNKSHRNKHEEKQEESKHKHKDKNIEKEHKSKEESRDKKHESHEDKSKVVSNYFSDEKEKRKDTDNKKEHHSKEKIKNSESPKKISKDKTNDFVTEKETRKYTVKKEHHSKSEKKRESGESSKNRNKDISNDLVNEKEMRKDKEHHSKSEEKIESGESSRNTSKDLKIEKEKTKGSEGKKDSHNNIDKNEGKREKKRDFSEFMESDVSVLEDTPKGKKKKIDRSLNESVLTDEERHERKMHCATLYKQYLNRSGPKHLGTKEIPEGAPNCLAHCAFLLTGVLDSFERDEVVAAITKYGGCVKSGISKKVTHVLAGDDAGPAKMAKAQDLGIKILSEDEFLQLIIDNSKDPSHKKTEPNKDQTPSKSKNSPKDKYEAKPSEAMKIKKEKSKDSLKEDHRGKSKSPSKKEDKPSPRKKSHELEIKNEADFEKASTSKSVEKDTVKQEAAAQPSASSSAIISPNAVMWVEKYKPQSLKQIIGQHGDASNVKKLMNWLTKWYVNRKAKLVKPSPWAKNDDGGYYKAALLSGPPGVGKTTTVALVCKELGFDMVEFNASDTRNKSLIKEQIGELLTTTSLAAYAMGNTGKQAITKKHVLVMDEVDGMAGNEDRGGMQELIALIKSTSVPIICMCNDRNSQKMRSLVNYCFDLRFNRPRVEQIKSAMMSICCKEGVKIPPDALTQLIIAANQDVRQTLNLLSMWAVDSNLADSERLKKEAQSTKKDLKLGPFEAVRKVFSAEEHKTMSIADKSDLFFYDYSLAPLFVQENYLHAMPNCPKHEVLQRLARAADSISAGDLVDAKIRRQQAWNLLPVQAMFSSVIPGHHMSGHLTGQIQFPGWLGKNSRATKMQRLCQEIHAHTRLSTSGSKSSIFLDYSRHIRDTIIQPLCVDRTNGIDKVLEIMESYHLLREDLDSLTELCSWPGQVDPMNLIDSKVKAAMTRAYNKKAAALPYAPGNIKRGRAKIADDNDDADEDEVEEVDSDPENDALIKKKKVKEEKPSTSKERPKSEKAGSSKDKASLSKKKK